MSIYGMTMNAHLDPDPYVACHYDITEHPHYHDCGICRHAKAATCLWGKMHVVDLWFDAFNGDEAAKEALIDMGFTPNEPLNPKFFE